METPGVLVLTPDAPAYLPLLRSMLIPCPGVTAAVSAKEALEVYADQTVLLARPDLAAEVLERLHDVHWVQSTWAGVTPLLSLQRDDFILTGVKDAFGPQMAEYVLAYLLSRELRVFERLGRQASRSWWQAPSGSLRGKTMGIMGTGSIGREIARRARPFGVDVLGYNRSGAHVDGFEKVFAAGRLGEFLSGLDYLICVLPDTPETRHLLDASAFAAMEPGCYLVNVGRGSLIDEQALAEALVSRQISGAVLDVFEQEPLPKGSPLWHAPGLIVTGHVAAQSYPQDIARIFSENYRRYVADEPLRYRVDFDRGY
jgi:phosphoglycerate dehydrogenase-like enzyme